MADAPPAVNPSDRIVFFDGTCGFCDRTVTFLFSLDQQHALRFAPLQGATAARILPPERIADLDTIVYRRGKKDYQRSGAVLRSLWDVGGAWALMGCCLVVPWPLRDFVYDIVAANRYKWFGKTETCRLPSTAERAYFFD